MSELPYPLPPIKDQDPISKSPFHFLLHPKSRAPLPPPQSTVSRCFAPLLLPADSLLPEDPHECALLLTEILQLEADYPALQFGSDLHCTSVSVFLRAPHRWWLSQTVVLCP
jgi:hypothetical protein